eukprot:GHVU01164827.1.p2 GENE.GHVU01164827.1~~GHVU01164827.1.p2  ORF type:complete len:118 (+),score=1.71 GHVU01164827.1:152-505(+)
MCRPVCLCTAEWCHNRFSAHVTIVTNEKDAYGQALSVLAYLADTERGHVAGATGHGNRKVDETGACVYNSLHTDPVTTVMPRIIRSNMTCLERGRGDNGAQPPIECPYATPNNVMGT